MVCFTREHSVAQLPNLLQGVDFVFHLAGINRPQDPQEFVTGNLDLTQALSAVVAEVAVKTGKKVPEGFVYASDNNPEWMTNNQLQSWITANKEKIGSI